MALGNEIASTQAPRAGCALLYQILGRGKERLTGTAQVVTFYPAASNDRRARSDFKRPLHDRSERYCCQCYPDYLNSSFPIIFSRFRRFRRLYLARVYSRKRPFQDWLCLEGCDLFRDDVAEPSPKAVPHMGILLRLRDQCLH